MLLRGGCCDSCSCVLEAPYIERMHVCARAGKGAYLGAVAQAAPLRAVVIPLVEPKLELPGEVPLEVVDQRPVEVAAHSTCRSCSNIFMCM